MTISEFEETLNSWGQNKVPFLFFVDFEMEKPVAIRLDDIDPSLITYDINGNTNSRLASKGNEAPQFTRFPLSYNDYDEMFQMVYQHLSHGDSYLTNLTIKTQVATALTLGQLFDLSKARYKLRYKNEFLVFSPEIFVQIKDRQIYSYPMKGTINAAIPNAQQIILSDQKELAEHVTIVDLIRNDLSQVASDVTVNRFRYLDLITTNHHRLYQVSSEIMGLLPSGDLHLGTILIKLLPAGSVSGAPKPKTVEIIRRAEKGKRGYYTGVMGIFDGRVFDSGVMIRFIEHENENYYYRSGGGITTQSDSLAEYREAIEKIYVPVS
jgi:para-aminobenzoate synthetase component 1